MARRQSPSVFSNTSVYSCNKTKVYFDHNLKDMLLEFTMNALLDQPDGMVGYAQEYFNKLASPTAVISYETIVSDASEQSNEYNPAEFVRTRKQVIYSEAYNPEKDNGESDTELPVHQKNHVLQKKLIDVCKQCLLFRNLDRDDLQRVIMAMFKRIVYPDEYVIKQGEDGDNFYVIQNGTYDVFVNDEYLMTYEEQGSFGDLALMYNMPRAASVRAKTYGTLWALDRMTFRRIVLKGVYKKRRLYEEFLNTVPMLQTMSHYERMNVADALVPKTIQEGEIIIEEGDKADGMYFIESGQVEITKKHHRHNIQRVLKPGEYFGELALVTKKPRAATAKAMTDCKLAFLDVDAFERVLGPCMKLMERNIADYEYSHAADAESHVQT